MKQLNFLLILFLALVLSACSNSRIEPKSLYGNTITEFSGTDEMGKPISNKDLKGKVWLVDFIFTNCETVCPPMTYNMSQVADQLEKDGISHDDYGIISFSVDPKKDTPQKLNDYINQHNPPKGVWKAVTKYDEKFIRQFAEENFKTIVVPPTANNTQATHGTSFYLVDQSGMIIKDYAGKDTGDKKFPKAEIVEDVKTMIEEGPYKK
ncbi:SCO family protein [Macrococcoides canis]|uniref:SCO family protein n=1 Tax=Macrococcoides canis TaxID=1855823 RepID=UPI001AEC3605|nr:SCO family protein [Macrococcus canis]QTQ09236.1 SCO family protein [Macrococcus canis]UTH03503.1 SCO family protein [Macrococcus canis]